MNQPVAGDFITDESAPGIKRIDVEPVNKKEDRQLYASRQAIYPKLAHGTFRNLKWVVMAVTLGIYYLLPWLRWPRGEGMPTQAFLADVENGRLFVGPIEIWPQEFYYVTGLLVLGALVLFLVTSAFGRVWCGYTCPQTVWTDLMVAVERFWQGDRNARIRLDRAPWTAKKIYRKTMTHLTWILISVLTGGAFVFYFRDAPTLAVEFVTGTAPMIAYLFLGLFAATTYLLGAIAREQVCIYMCPWPRIQGAMTDQHTMLVSYRTERGETRGPAHRGPDGLVDWSSRGDCIDCKACIAVCPTGIDIRDGSQLECIQCGLCIDACNEIMTKISRPRDLIAYDTVAKREASERGEHEPFQLIRARTMLYAGLIAFVMAIMVFGYSTRTTLEVNVMPDRSPLYVQLGDGSVRNGYTVKVLNKEHTLRTVKLSVTGLPDAELTMLGFDTFPASVEVPTDNLRELRVFVKVPADQLAKLTPPSTQFQFVVEDVGATSDKAKMARTAIFQSPKR